LHLRPGRLQSAYQKASGRSGSRCTSRISDCDLRRHKVGRSTLEFHKLHRLTGNERCEPRQAAVLGVTR
jgi:hypothetical protein